MPRRMRFYPRKRSPETEFGRLENLLSSNDRAVLFGIQAGEGWVGLRNNYDLTEDEITQSLHHLVEHGLMVSEMEGSFLVTDKGWNYYLWYFKKTRPRSHFE